MMKLTLAEPASPGSPAGLSSAVSASAGSSHAGPAGSSGGLLGAESAAWARATPPGLLAVSGGVGGGALGGPPYWSSGSDLMGNSLASYFSQLFDPPGPKDKNPLDKNNR